MGSKFPENLVGKLAILEFLVGLEMMSVCVVDSSGVGLDHILSKKLENF